MRKNWKNGHFPDQGIKKGAQIERNLLGAQAAQNSPYKAPNVPYKALKGHIKPIRSLIKPLRALQDP